MCGITGFVGTEESSSILLNGIRRLEYRGYDSVGMVTYENGFHLKKDVGEVDAVDKKLNFKQLPGKIGIAHTRWCTHGGVTQKNAHPHSSENVVAVHNGIIENYEKIKKDLEKKGAKFVSETDSEIIPHYLENKIDSGKTVHEAIVDFMNEAEGTFAILFMVKGDEKLYCLKRDSPLVLGIAENGLYVASDIYAFSDKTNKAVFFDNDEFMEVDKNGFKFYNKDGKEITKQIQKFDWDQKQSSKKEYDHFMLKEISEEPEVAKRLLLSLESDQKDFFEKLVNEIKNSKKVVFVACGTSYHATLLGAYYFHKCGVESQTLIASEFEHFANIDKDTLVITFSQSGETMDVIDALKYSKEKNAKIVSIVNVPHSTIQRMSDFSLNIHAGQEVCVASTKAFINQVILLLKVAKEFGFEVDLDDIPDKIESIFKFIPKIKELGKELSSANDMYLLGRGLSYPVAREMALKIKEISYIHAEGMMGGELKHGTIALIEKGTPVISLVHKNDAAMISNSKEVEARGARVVMLGDPGEIHIDGDEGTFGILASVVGQLIAYYTALERGCSIDKPRNLAKSVTVR